MRCGQAHYWHSAISRQKKTNARLTKKTLSRVTGTVFFPATYRALYTDSKMFLHWQLHYGPDYVPFIWQNGDGHALSANAS